ncbi:hypothetical protein IFR05_011503 [Cadophora sp. M221]|nr:hypothetical protein IFR05_011503 [Cadophora sp. M221]
MAEASRNKKALSKAKQFDFADSYLQESTSTTQNPVSEHIWMHSFITATDDCEAHNINNKSAAAQSTHENSTKVSVAGNLADLVIPLSEKSAIVYGSTNRTQVEWLEETSSAYGTENDFDSPVGPYEEAPQLQAWVYEISDPELTFGERLQKGYWEK